MATPFDRLMETVRPYLPGSIEAAIRQELFMVCKDFFANSNTWQEVLDFTVDAGKQEAEVMPYTGRIERLLDVVDKDEQPVRGATMPDATTGLVRLPFPVNQDGEYKALVALTVSDPVARDAFPIVPYDLAQKYTDELMSGLLSRMLAQPSKPYTNLTLAQYYLLKYRGSTARARNEMRNGNTYGSQRWSFPQTFNRRK